LYELLFKKNYVKIKSKFNDLRKTGTAGKTIRSEETFITEMIDEELIELITLPRLKY